MSRLSKMLSPNVRLSNIYDPLSAGSTTNSPGSDPVDMSVDGGFEGCMFMLTVGSVSTSITLAAQASTSTTVGDFAAIQKNSTNLSVSSTASNGILMLDVYPVPTGKRYLRCTVNSTGGNLTGGLIACQYGGRTHPTTNDSTDVLAEDRTVTT